MASRPDAPTLPELEADAPLAATVPSSGDRLETRANAAPDDPFAAFTGPLLLGRFQLGRELARGGMGRVTLACDRQLERVVAVKEMLDASPEAQQRFERETRITAQLQHPGIIAVYESGHSASGAPFYVMRQVPGRSLAEALAECPTARARLELLSHVIAAADALGYAHGRGVVHRDLKPGNILVGPFGETVVIDWGLARRLDQAEAETPMRALPTAIPEGPLTQVGAVMGTPAYMPPEQAGGRPVDARADVYSLGAIIREVLTGAPPYPGARPLEVLGRVLAGPPAPLSPTELGVPSDLVAIVAKAMAREPAERYPNASALAQELRRFQGGQRVGAHQYSLGELLNRWVRRHLAELGVAAVAAVALMAVAVVAAVQVVQQRNAARQGEQRALLEVARQRVLDAPTLAVQTLQRLDPELPGWDDARLIAEDALSRGVATWALPLREVDALAVADDGSRAAAATRSGDLWLWERGATSVRRVAHLPIEAHLLAFGIGSTTLAVAAPTGAVELYDLRAGTHRPVAAAGQPVESMLFLQDGTLAVGRGGSEVELVTLAGALSEHISGVTGATFHPRTHLLGIARGEELLIRGGSTGPRAVALPAGARLLTLAPTGERVAVQQVGGNLAQLDLTSDPPAEHTLAGDEKRSVGADWADGHRLVVLRDPHAYEVWDAGVRLGGGTLDCEARDVNYLAPGHVVFACDNQIEFLDLDGSATRLAFVSGLAGELPTLASDGSLAAAVGADGNVWLWDLRQPPHPNRQLGMQPAAVLWARDGLLVIGRNAAGVVVTELDPATLTTRHEWGPLAGIDTPVRGPLRIGTNPDPLVALSRDGQWLAWADQSDGVGWLDLHEGKLGTTRAPGLVGLGINAANQIVVATANGWQEIDPGSGTTVKQQPAAHLRSLAATALPGVVLAIGNDEPPHLLRDDGTEAMRFDGAAGWALSSRDGTRWVAPTAGGALQVWSATGGARGAPCGGDGHQLLQVALSADARHAATGDVLGHSFVWDLDACARAPIPAISTVVARLAISDDGTQVAAQIPERRSVLLADVDSPAGWNLWHSQPRILLTAADWANHRIAAITASGVELWVDDLTRIPAALHERFLATPQLIAVQPPTP